MCTLNYGLKQNIKDVPLGRMWLVAETSAFAANQRHLALPRREFVR